MKTIKKSLGLFLLTLFIVFNTTFTHVSALSSGTSFTLSESYRDALHITGGKIGTGLYFVLPGRDYQLPILYASSNKEFVYCIQPGITTVAGDGYQGGNLYSMIQGWHNGYNNRISIDQKIQLIGRVLSLIPENRRYHAGSEAVKLDSDCFFYVVQTFIWEIIAGERNMNFDHVGISTAAKNAGCQTIYSILSFRDQNVYNRFWQIRKDMESVLKKYTMTISGTQKNAEAASTIVLDQYNTQTKEYYTTFKDTNGVAKWYRFISDPAISVSVDSQNNVTIKSKNAFITPSLVRGEHTKICDYGGNEKNIVQGHVSTTGHQHQVSLVGKSSSLSNVYFKVKTLNEADSTLTIDPNGGTWNGKNQKTYVTQHSGAAYTISHPTRIGYTFLGWESSGGGFLDGKLYKNMSTTPNVTYSAHISYIGWGSWVSSNQSANVYGNNPLEAFQISLDQGLHHLFDISYRAHVENIGWQGWQKNGGMVGTVGRSLHMQAIEMKLTGKLKDYFDLAYRVNVEGSWQPWVYNGQMAGTTGQGKNLYNIQVKLIKKTNVSVTPENKFYFTNQNATLKAIWKANQYTNYIDHWLFGLTKGEGNNTGKYAWKIGNTSFKQSYGQSFILDERKAKTIPNGFYLDPQFGSSSISGSWQNYPMKTSVIQKAKNMNFEFRYRPITYTITYLLQGGQSQGAMPSTYNVLYGFTLPEVVKEGYHFTGWYLNGRRITGINELSDNHFTSEKHMYASLSSRTTGNLVIEARFDNEAPEITTPIIKDSVNDVPFIEEETLIIQKGDPFDPMDFIQAYDKEDGDLTYRVVIEEDPMIRDESGNVSVSGTYVIKLSVTDLGGKKSEEELVVHVNEPPVIKAQDRYFFVGDPISKEILLEKVQANDKEDGDLLSKVMIDMSHIDPNQEGIYEVIYRVKDHYHKEVSQKIYVHFLNTTTAKHDQEIRYIALDRLLTLSNTSKWYQNANLFKRLETTLSKPIEDTSCLYVFEWSGKENEQLQTQMDTPALFDVFKTYLK